MLYEREIAERDAPKFAGLEGVLLQSHPRPDGLSTNEFIARLQQATGTASSTRRQLPVLPAPLTEEGLRDEAMPGTSTMGGKRGEMQMKDKKNGSKSTPGVSNQNHENVREIPLVDIMVPERRARRLRDVTRLVESIAQSDLIEPIIVRRLPDGRLVLVAGLHRLEAHRKLHRETILTRIIEVSDLEAELIELDENLTRIELTVLERGEHLLRRKESYEQLHPETKQGGAPGKKGGGKQAKDATVASFAEDTSAKTNLSMRTIQDDVKIARLGEDTKKVLRGTPLEDQKRVLLQITRIAPEKQAVVAEAVASGRCRTVQQAAIELGVKDEPQPRRPHGDVAAHVREVARSLREARRRLDGVIKELDPVHASEAHAIGGEIAALEQKITALGRFTETPTAPVPPNEAIHALASQEHGPQADVAAAVDAVIEVQRIVTADETLAITGLGLDELREGEALAGGLAETAKVMTRLSRLTRGRRRGAPRRSVAVPNFVRALQPILPAKSRLAQDHGDVLRAWEVFGDAGMYLRKIEPALELAYNLHMATRANLTSATICDAIERFIEHGRAFVAGKYTFLHQLDAQGVPLAIFRDAEAAFVQEVTEGMRTTLGTLGEESKRSPRQAQNAPTTTSGIRLPITAPLDESAFEEVRETVRDCVASMEQGCDMLVEMYRGHCVPPDVQRIWFDVLDRAQQCRPLIDGTFTHADHLCAWGVEPSMSGRQEAVQQRPEVPRSSDDMHAEPKLLPAAAQKEFGAILGRYMSHGRREQVEEEIRKADWPAHVQEAALQQFWDMAGKPETPALPPPDEQDPPIMAYVTGTLQRMTG